MDTYNGPIAMPTATRRDDGYVTLDWPENAPPVALVAREVLVQMVADLNEARGLKP